MKRESRLVNMLIIITYSHWQSDFSLHSGKGFLKVFLLNVLSIIIFNYFKKCKGPLRVLLEISLCTEIGTANRFFVTSCAENYLMCSLIPYLLFRWEITFLMQPNQNYRPMNILFCIEHNDERFLQSMNLSPPPPPRSTKVSHKYVVSYDKN